MKIQIATSDEFWGAPISVYTRAQAIEDGVLVDGHMPDITEVTRQHFGSMSVAMSIGVFEMIQKAVASKKHCNDFLGVWHDICWMAPKRKEPGDYQFRVIVTGVGRSKYHTIKATYGLDDDGGPTITFLLPDED